MTGRWLLIIAVALFLAAIGVIQFIPSEAENTTVLPAEAPLTAPP